MDLRPYEDSIRSQLELTADAGGEDARVVADRLIAPLQSAIRLALQDVLVAAAEEITCELAPGSVELRLRGRDVDLVVTPPPGEPAPDQLDRLGMSGPDGRATTSHVPIGDRGEGDRGEGGESADPDEGSIARINVRMPEHLKSRVERAAAAAGLSVNAWLVRVAAAAADRVEPAGGPDRRTPHGAQRFTGWAR